MKLIDLWSLVVNRESLHWIITDGTRENVLSVYDGKQSVDDMYLNWDVVAFRISNHHPIIEVMVKKGD